MGQKVNPISLRLETTNRGFDSCYYNHTHSTQLFVENLRLQLYLNNLLKQTGFSQGRVLISTFFRGCESNLFYLNPLYSRENKGKRFLIKSSRPTSSLSVERRKKKDVGSHNKVVSHPSLPFKVNPLKEVLKRVPALPDPSYGRKGQEGKELVFSERSNTNSFPFSLFSNKVGGNSFLDLPFFFPSLNKSSFLKKIKDVDREEAEGACFTEKRETLSKAEEGLKTTTFSGKKRVSSDVSKQLSLLVYLYQLVENKKFSAFSRVGVGVGAKHQHQHQKESLFTGEKTGVHGENETNIDGSREKKGFLFKKENSYSLSSYGQEGQGGQRQTDRKIKEVSFFFPSVPTFSDFFFGGIWYSQRNKGVFALQRRKDNKERVAPHVGDLLVLPSPLKEEKGWLSSKEATQPLIREIPFLQKQNSFLTVREDKRVNKDYLEQKLFKDTGLVFYLSFLRALNSTQSALFLCQDIVYYLEKRVSFQRIKTVLLEQVSRDIRIKGIRVTCSGRVGGKSKRAQRSKVETFKDGQTSLGVFSSKIDFHCESGLTGFGLVGVKVWICYP